VEESDVTGLSFDRGADAGAVIRADDSVSFRMAGDAAIGRFEAAVVVAQDGPREQSPARNWRA
jgi:hypothetical protein